VVVVAAGGLFAVVVAGRNRVDVAPVVLAAGVERLESRIRSYEIERECFYVK
jgi:hypothetical protein